jgi:steroid delta-isomerase-like uncharacterized protein
MSAEQNKTVIKKLFDEIMNGRKFDAIKDVISPTFTHHGIPDAKGGPDGFREVMEQFTSAFPDMKINPEHIIADGDMVATRGHWTGTNNGSFMGMPATNKKVNVQFIDVWKIQDGKCQENWVQMDMVGMMQQIGMAPATA